MYKFSLDLFNTELKVKEINLNKNIPIHKLKTDIYEKLAIKQGDYKSAIIEMKKELDFL